MRDEAKLSRPWRSPENLAQPLLRPILDAKSCYSPAMARLLALIIAGTMLASCAGSGRNLGDYVPAWAGGLPKNAPPRPGTPEYDAWRANWDADAVRDKSKDPPKDKTDAEAGTPGPAPAAPPAR